MSQSSVRDVCVVSAYGRGHWLAADLASKGHKVTLIDVSPSMGRWAPEDWEGPFGFFQTDHMSPLQIECLNEQDYHDPVDEGFTLWLKNGPLDMKGPISQHLQKEMKLLDNFSDFIVNSDNLEAHQIHRLLEIHPFSKTWLVYLAYTLAANRIDIDTISLDSDLKALPILSPLSVRRVSRRGWEKAMEWCESKGVEVIGNVEPTDISVSGKSISSLEIKGDWSGVVNARHFVWMLTGEESLRFPEKISKSLYPRGVLKSAWSWLRYRFQLGSGAKNLPQKLVIIEDIYLPWTHENLCLMQKTVNGVDADIWLRIPSQHRFQRGYVEDLCLKVKEILRQRLPEMDPKILDMPQDYLYEEKELGPSPFPVYESREFSNYSWTSFKNLNFESPEQWSPQDWSGQMAHQVATVKSIHNNLLEKQNKKPEPEVHP